jgi:NADH-quinone oxidoreductase subunit F
VSGLFGQPTVVNNVETLANVPLILASGPDQWRAVGTSQSPGTKLFCLSGHVERPGVYEVPFGTPIGSLIEELGGGVRGGRALQAIQCGGAAGTFLRPDDLDLPLTFEDLRARGATVGSGAIVVMDETVDLRDVLRRTAEFFAHESCGQCVPCRVGTVRQVELLARSAPHGTALLEEVGQVMRDASICGLGQTASNAVLSAMKEFGL